LSHDIDNVSVRCRHYLFKEIGIFVTAFLEDDRTKILCPAACWVDQVVSVEDRIYKTDDRQDARCAILAKEVSDIIHVEELANDLSCLEDRIITDNVDVADQTVFDRNRNGESF
jgi:hypothetical protein